MKPSTSLAVSGRAIMAAWNLPSTADETIREVWLDMHSPPAELLAIHTIVLRI
jgi:hypothetical protein